MESDKNMKALYIIVNTGFADEIVEKARKVGAGGATVINARGTGTVHKEFMGITIDAEKELIISVVDGDTADRIMAVVKESAGAGTPANGICFVMPVERLITVNKYEPPEIKKS